MSADWGRYLRATPYIESEAPAVRELAERAIRGATTDVDKAVRLYYDIRDDIRYDPYAISAEPDDYRAAAVLQKPGAYCIQKAIVLAAAARAVGIPSRLGYADVRNHLTSPKLFELMGSDLFMFHGYTDLYLDGNWVKSTPAFNLALCERFGVRPLEFDGREDSIFHPFDAQNRRHMEYIRYYGTFEDFPYAQMMTVFDENYPGLWQRLKKHSGRDVLFHGQS